MADQNQRISDLLDTLTDADSTEIETALRIFEPNDVAAVVAQRALAGGGGGGGSQPSLPIAPLTGSSIDSTTYDDPILNDGTKMRVLVLPAEDTALAIAIEGDAFPRYIIGSDTVDGIWIGDGTFDPYNDGSAYLTLNETADGWKMGGNGGGLITGQQINDAPPGTEVGANGTMYLQATAISVGADVPAIGGNIGDFYFRFDGDGSLGQAIYRCTVAGTAGLATWVGLT